jgi:DNA repair exonuclease SbcCD ATPase subunit
MSQNLLRSTGEDDRKAEDDARPAFAQGARGLLDHLNSALSADEDDLPPVITQAPPRMPNFGMAVTRQAEQIHYLAEQIDRLDRDTQMVELRKIVRDLYGVLGDMALRMKQTSSEAATKIALLTGAVTIIGSASGQDEPHDVTAVLDRAKAAAERLSSLERLTHDAHAAIAALEDSAFRDRDMARELSAGLATSNERAESDRKEIAGLLQKIESTDRTLAGEMTKIGEALATDRKETAGLQQRLDETDRTLTKTVAGIDDLEAQNAERFARLTRELESLAQTNQALVQEKEQTAARLQAMEQALAAITGRQNALSAWHDRIAHVLSTNPEAPADETGRPG